MKIIVYLGTGGVGKTSVAAATALAQARAGTKSLVLTIDPALLDVRATLDEAVRLYGKSSTANRILNHPIYATIADSLAGMQELMAVERIDQLTRRGFEHIVVDTAPSRHALEFLDKPMFFSELVGSGWVKAVGRTYKIVERTGMLSLGRKTVDLYARAESILGANLVRQVLDFYSLFVSIAEGYAERAEKTVAMLKDPAVTEFHVVTTPQKALRDARFFHEALGSRKFPIGALYVNRVWGLEPGPEFPDGLARRVMDWYKSVRASHVAAVEAVTAEYKA